MNGKQNKPTFIERCIVIIRLDMEFDDQYTYTRDEYPNLTKDELIQMMKDDFIDTIYKQWTSEELEDALEVIEQ